MKKIICIFFSFLIFAGASFGDVMVADSFDQLDSSAPTIKVLLTEDVISALIEVKGGYKVSSDNVIIANGSFGRRFSAHALYGGIRWGDEYPNLKHIIISPVDDAFVFVNGIQYKGCIHILSKDNRCIDIVNELDIEDFLKSVLSLKYMNKVSKEALFATVILERTALYNKLLESCSIDSDWHIIGNDAKYYGHGVSMQFCGVEEAIEWTNRMILDSVPSDFVEILVDENKGLLLEDFMHLSSIGYDAKQILESFYPEASFVLVDSWSPDACETLL